MSVFTLFGVTITWLNTKYTSAISFGTFFSSAISSRMWLNYPSQGFCGGGSYPTLTRMSILKELIDSKRSVQFLTYD